MKTSRDELKAIVKQCLIEILSEGIGSSSKFQTQHASKISGVVEQRVHNPRLAFDPSLDTPIKRDVPNTLKETIKRSAAGNKMMESIFADTAVTTLPQMAAHGDTASVVSSAAPAHAITQQEQFNGSPEQVFGTESASRWASLAFADATVKKSA
jgi:hypothetical protein